MRRGLFVAAAAVGGNLPDADLVFSYRGFAANKLGYMLEHRGYTHTIIGCLVLALMLYGGVLLWARLRRLTLARQDHYALAGMAVFATLLHLGMDALNSYGVHPFWPFNNAWFYGDSVFIVEPLYWVAVAPLLFVVPSMFARIVVGIALLAAIVIGVMTHRAQPAWYVGIVLLTIGLLVVGKRGSARTASLVSAGVTISVTLMFILAGRAAASRAESLAAHAFPSEQQLDHVLSPAPMNPFCWDLLLVQAGGGQYTVRHGLLANAPGVTPPAQCPRLLNGTGTTAPMAPVRARDPSSPQHSSSTQDSSSAQDSGSAQDLSSAQDADEVQWFGEFSMPVARLAALVERNCDAASLLQFARAPFATEVNDRWVIGDLRFDREAGLGFAEIELTGATQAPANCHPRVPWVPPRPQLLPRSSLSH